jgi:hypothetical protein
MCLYETLRNFIRYRYDVSIITSQLHCFQLRTTLDGKDFKFFSHGLCTEKQNILLQHMHEKHFWILINTYGNKHWHENEAPCRDLEPRFRVKAYFQGRRNDAKAKGADFRERALLNWYILRANFHSGKLSVDWNGQESFFFVLWALGWN